jgi:hypothetical protein
LISRIPAEIARLQHIVALGAQPLGKAKAGTPIYEEPHRPTTTTASRESCATTACA